MHNNNSKGEINMEYLSRETSSNDGGSLIIEEKEKYNYEPSDEAIDNDTEGCIPSKHSSDTLVDSVSLIRNMLPQKKYPIEVFPEIMKNLAADITKSMGVENDLVGNCLLSACALAVQQHGNLDIDGRIIPSSLFCMTVCESGSRKSSVNKKVLEPHKEWQIQKDELYQKENDSYITEQNCFDERKKAISRVKKMKYDEKIAKIKELKSPQRPIRPLLVVNNITTEGLNKQLSQELPYTGVFIDEGGSLIGGYSMKPENMIKSLADFISLWDISPEIRIRAGSGVTHIYDKRVSMHLMAQPAVANKLLGTGIAHEQGFIPRFLICWSNSSRGKHQYNPINLSTTDSMKAYKRRILDLLNTKPCYSDESNLHLKPRNIPLSKSAYNLWIDFYNDIEAKNTEGGMWDSVSAWASRAAEHALRIALTFALFDNLNCDEIHDSYMQAGIVLSKFYLYEMYRLRGVGEITEKIDNANKLLKHMRQNKEKVNGMFSKERLLQYGPNCIREKGALSEALEILSGEKLVMTEKDENEKEKWVLTVCCKEDKSKKLIMPPPPPFETLNNN